MDIRCRISWHDWRRRETARPGTTVYRCQRCDQRIILHNGRQRRRKRRYLIAAVALCALFWFATINLGLYGHTRLLLTANRTVAKVDATGRRVRAAIHRAQGDKGAYVEGDTPPPR